MRTIERFAFILGIANLVLGVLALFSPFVSQRRPRGIARYLPRRRRGLINRSSGQLLGGLGAVNPPHAVMHSLLGAAGLATLAASGFSRAYLWINGILFAALAVMGWSRIGFRPGIHHSMGMALDWKDNVLHTLWAAGALLLAIKPDLGSTSPVDRGLELAEAGLTG